MKSKYELTISSNYVKDWTYLQAVREFFQNAIDEEASNSNHSMSYQYDSNEEILTISNQNSKLDVNTLLLGNTSKSNGSYIGSFGEGYKIGILVLLREGKTITIYNGNDLWTTKLINSRRYNSEIPVIEVQKNYRKGNTSLTVEIGNLSEDEYHEIVNSNLRIKEDELNYIIGKTHTDYGDLLVDESEKGNVYVGGLLVTTDFELKYGYDLNPKYVTLNRDRNMISSFDLIWNTSRIIATAFSDHLDKLLDSLDSKDTDYIDSFLKSNSRDDLARFFTEKHGDRIPVTTQEEYNYFKSRGMNPIIVKEKVKSLIGVINYDDYYDHYNSDGSLYDKIKEVMAGLSDFVMEDGLADYQELESLIDQYKDDLSNIKYSK